MKCGCKRCSFSFHKTLAYGFSGARCCLRSSVLRPFHSRPRGVRDPAIRSAPGGPGAWPEERRPRPLSPSASPGLGTAVALTRQGRYDRTASKKAVPHHKQVGVVFCVPASCFCTEESYFCTVELLTYTTCISALIKTHRALTVLLRRLVAVGGLASFWAQKSCVVSRPGPRCPK